jgi:hypothetical protein
LHLPGWFIGKKKRQPRPEKITVEVDTTWFAIGTSRDYDGGRLPPFALRHGAIFFSFLRMHPG